MKISKHDIVTSLIEQLAGLCDNARQAAEDARELATHEQSKPETQYDTVGLEASYLAHGQSMRAAELQQSLHYWQARLNTEIECEQVVAGSLVFAEDSNGDEHYYLVGDFAGGFKVEIADILVTVVTPQAPLGAALINKYVDDEVVLELGHRLSHFDIIDIQ